MKVFVGGFILMGVTRQTMDTVWGYWKVVDRSTAAGVTQWNSTTGVSGSGRGWWWWWTLRGRW